MSFYLLESTFLYHWKAYGASPTDLEKSDFFHILAKKNIFSDFLGFNNVKYW